MKKLLLVAAIVCLVATGAQAQNLLVNSGFESGSGQVIDPWVITGDGGQIPIPNFQGNLTTVKDGIYCYGNDAGWSNQTGTAIQTIQGIGTGTFTLSGWLWVTDGGQTPSSITLSLLVDGTQVASQTLSAALTYGTGWQLKTMNWTGTANSSIAAKISHNTTGADVYVSAYGAVAADALSLTATNFTAVPEPGSILAIATGLIGLIGIRRRR